MNSQFSIGFVIALVIGITVGAMWPKYVVGPNDTALRGRQDAQEVSYAQTNGKHLGRGVSGGCEESGNGHAGRGNAGRGQGGGGVSSGCKESDNGHAGRSNAGRGAAGRGQGGGGCSGGCKESGNGHAGRGVAHAQSGRGQGQRGQGQRGQGQRGQGRHGSGSFASVANDGCRDHQAEDTKLAASQPCQKSNGHGEAKATCSSEEECEKDLHPGRRGRNAQGQEPVVNASKANAHHPERSQHDGDRDTEDSMTRHRGGGLGLGLGLGPGWGRGFEMADSNGTDDEAQAAENE